MSDCESASSSADYFTAEDEDDVVVKDIDLEASKVIASNDIALKDASNDVAIKNALNSNNSEVSLEPEFLLWLSSDGTKWYVPKYYRPELDLDFCVSKFEKIMDEFT